jgi:ketosteroid isomerase-like protein
VELPPFARRLLQATNSHDVEAIVACFSPDYENVTPCHPARGFRGNQQVRRNWTAILDAVPDLRAEVVATSSGAGVEWTQWDMQGTSRDGRHYHLRGVIVFDVDADISTGCRFFLEPVEEDP